VKFVMIRISSRSAGTRSRSTFSKSRAISPATLRRRRSAWTKSTAERKRDCRNVFGQASGTCTFNLSSPRESVSSSKAAAASAKRIVLSEEYGQSGSATSTGVMPTRRTVSRAARSTSVAGLSFIQAGK
jgi:hypothetical protein